MDPNMACSGGDGAYIPHWRGEARWQPQVKVEVVVVHAIVPMLGPCWTQLLESRRTFLI